MKVEVGKFYKTRDGRKVELKMRGDTFTDYKFVFDLLPTEECSTYRAICDEVGKNPYNSHLDIIEEWKEPEVKEPKFKVGDRVTEISGKWSSKTGNKIAKVTETDYYIAPSYDESMSFPYSIEVWDNRLELVESAKPEITIGSRWTFNPDSFVCRNVVGKSLLSAAERTAMSFLNALTMRS